MIATIKNIIVGIIELSEMKENIKELEEATEEINERLVLIEYDLKEIRDVLKTHESPRKDKKRE